MSHSESGEFYPLPSKLNRINSAFFQRNRIVPLGCKKGSSVLVCAVEEGSNSHSIEILSVYTGMPIEKRVVSREDFKRLLDAFLEQRGREAVIGVVEDLEESAFTEITQEIPDGHDLSDYAANEPPIIKLVNLLFSVALKDRASDIHIQPSEREVRVRFRIDGLLYDMFKAPKRVHDAIVSRIKVMSGLDVAEKRLPQDGRIKLRINEREIDVRVSIVPTSHGEQVVMRLLDKSASFITIDEIGMDDDLKKKFISVITRPQGVILVTGPTGSGKTTTLYAALQFINTPEKNILTIEDPIEYLIPGVGQTQVNPKINLDFARALRSFLRQDPDVIMVGEIRDEETARIAIQAALTGHLVFSTLHTNDAASALTRLADMGIEPYLLSSSITAILAQRLVRKVCPFCAEYYEPRNAEKELLSRFAGGNSFLLRVGRGCERCLNTGFLGRTGVFEFLRVSNRIRELVHRNASSEEIKAQAVAEGMLTLREDGLKKVISGVTTLSEVLRVTIE
ncbi:MAG: type II secretion system ATPase GspE [candidate division WOR-3 bacterium]